MTKLNKEYTIDFNNLLNVRYGSINRLSPNVIYITCKTWLQPISDGNHSEIIQDAFKRFKQQLKKIVNGSPYFDNRLICDLDFNFNLIADNKQNPLLIEFYIKQQSNCIIPLKNIKNCLKITFKQALDDFIIDLESNTFKITKSKA